MGRSFQQPIDPLYYNEDCQIILLLNALFGDMLTAFLILLMCPRATSTESCFKLVIWFIARLPKDPILDPPNIFLPSQPIPFSTNFEIFEMNRVPWCKGRCVAGLPSYFGVSVEAIFIVFIFDSTGDNPYHMKEMVFCDQN